MRTRSTKIMQTVSPLTLHPSSFCIFSHSVCVRSKSFKWSICIVVLAFRCSCTYWHTPHVQFPPSLTICCIPCSGSWMCQLRIAFLVRYLQCLIKCGCVFVDQGMQLHTSHFRWNLQTSEHTPKTLCLCNRE